MNENTLNPQKFLLVSIIPHEISEEVMYEDLKELKDLVEALGGTVMDLAVQKREVHDKGMYIGRGKVFEIADIIKEKKH
jgi:50S ribosomal subunit-associated GTPase HflX